MIRHYLTIAFRNAWRNRAFTLINLIGLATGIACCLLIVLFVKDELSFDRWHSQADRIYRATEIIRENEVGEHSASMPFPFGPAVVNDFSGLVKASVRFFNFQAPTLSLAYVEKEREFNESRIFFVDSTLFTVFDFQLHTGNPQTALEQPNSIILTQSMAEKYFPEEDPMGKVLRFQGQQDLMVTGILEDVPLNSHFTFDFLVSFSSLKSMYNGGYPDGWYWNPCWTYLLLEEGVSPDRLLAQFPAFVDKYFHPAIKEFVTLELQPLTSIHLNSQLDYEIEPNSNEANIYIFSVIALFILLIACFNFMNLATARAVNRAREVGMRKTLGGRREQLIGQFLLESTAYSLIAVILAVILVELALPFFNGLAEKAIPGDFWMDPLMLLGLLGTVLLVGLGSGVYPAFVLTSFKPAQVLKGTFLQPRGLTFRKVLVVTQFTVSIMLLIGTGVAIRQLTFLQNDETGFEREHIVMLPVVRSSMSQQYETFREEALRQPGVRSVTAVEEVLGSKYQTANYVFEGMTQSKLFPRLNVRHDFIETFGMELLAGRDYQRATETDDSLALVINEALVRHLGWESPEDAIGKRFYHVHGEGRIVGVVKDFNFTSKHHPIGPIAVDLNTEPKAFELFIKYVAIRLAPGDPKASLTALSQTWKQMIPDKPFDYFFLDDNLRRLYQAEEKLTKVGTAFSGLAILVACLGLLGLATYTSAQRRKEIGIRKVMGSTTAQIVMLLSGDFTRLVLIAGAIALPIAWFATYRWLENFAYHIDFPFWVPGAAILAALGIAWLTISLQAFRAAQANPVEALKEE